MKDWRELPGKALRALGRPAARALRDSRYRRRLARGEAAGELRYVWRDEERPASWIVEVRLRETACSPAEAASWCRGQSLRELRVAGHAPDGKIAWRADRDGPVEGERPEAALFFFAPGRLVELDPVHLEACALILAAEKIDAVLLRPEDGSPLAEVSAESVTGQDERLHSLFRDGAFGYDAADDQVRPLDGSLLVKLVEPEGEIRPRTAETHGRRRRGPYLSSVDLGSRLEVVARDAGRLRRSGQTPRKPSMLVLSSFLARGGAEHTLFETLRFVRDRFDLTIVTLAPHRPELGDRRSDFREITPRIYSLGDWVHPAVMPGILASLLDATGAEILYNANGTTLFYDFVPGLKKARPGLRVLDHLYDHRVGYIDRYVPELLRSVDACIAENHRIARVLTEERGWPAERVPVIHPCGRLRSVFPAGEDAAAVRHGLRRELGIGPEDLVIFTAARMHPQKRPLDLVALARRVHDLEQVRFLIAGGGDLEAAVDAAIAESAARIVRLPFRTDIPELITAADVGCLVSDYEGLPVFLLECLQAGRPFLGTDTGDMGEVLRATGAGLVVERPGDLDALEACVRRLADPSAWATLSEHAREAGRGFDVETCAEKYAAAFLGELHVEDLNASTS